MKIESLGHVVLKVTDLDRSEQFYTGVLGMPVVARYDDTGYKMTFFSVEKHHDLALMQVSGAEAAAGGDVGDAGQLSINDHRGSLVLQAH